MNKDVMRHAMIDYARECYRREENRYSADVWVSVMNSYVRHADPETCALNAGITPLEASLLYCRFSIILTEAAMDSMRSHVFDGC